MLNPHEGITCMVPFSLTLYTIVVFPGKHNSNSLDISGESRHFHKGYPFLFRKTIGFHGKKKNDKDETGNILLKNVLSVYNLAQKGRPGPPAPGYAYEYDGRDSCSVTYLP